MYSKFFLSLIMGVIIALSASRVIIKNNPVKFPTPFVVMSWYADAIDYSENEVEKNEIKKVFEEKQAANKKAILKHYNISLIAHGFVAFLLMVFGYFITNVIISRAMLFGALFTAVAGVLSKQYSYYFYEFDKIALIISLLAVVIFAIYVLVSFLKSLRK